MKRILSLALLACLLFASVSGLSAQNLQRNSYYLKSLELQKLADQAFDEGNYDGAISYANQARDYAALSNEYVEKMVAMSSAERALKAAKDSLAAAETVGAPTLAPEAYGKAGDLLAAAEDSFGNDAFAEAEEGAKKAALAADAAKDAARASAAASLAAARERGAWADAEKVGDNYPAEYGAFKGELALAETAFAAENYPEAKARAEGALLALASVSGEIPLPASYVVRLIPERRDCLWRIAEYSFVYNNPLKWPVLYEANKKTFRDPNNPNLIYPGQVLQIPSLNGEVRKGAWDSTKTYPVFPKAKK